MSGTATGFERRVQSSLDALPSRIPVVLGGCGTGRSSLLRRLRDHAGRGTAQYVDVERCATTPERFLHAFVSTTPFPSTGVDRSASSPREAFDRLLQFCDAARGPGGEPCTFLLDEFLELRTFESFPGLRDVLQLTLDALSASQNRFVLTSRYAVRTQRLLKDAASRFELLSIPPLSPEAVTDQLAPWLNGYDQMSPSERDEVARAVHALADGRACYVQALGEAMAQMGRTPDPVSALTSSLGQDGVLARVCRFSYELRLHRARGYGALKAILDILAAEEPLNLTEIALRLRRTPGSTKDYLSWLEDVDLVTSRRKKYTFADPLLRLWVRLHCLPTPATADDAAREVQRYALARLAAPTLPPVAMGAGLDVTGDDRRNWGIIEID